MKIGVNTLLWTAGFDREHLPLLPRLKEAGLDGVEVARFAFDGFPAAEIGREIRREGLEVTFCSALTGRMSLASEDAQVRASARDFLRQGIETAAQIGARVFAGPFCSPVGYLPGRRRNEDEWRWAVEGLQSLGETLDRSNITLAVEPLNRFETFFLNTAKDAVRLCDQVGHPRVGILFDTFHANIEEKDLGAALSSCGGRLKHIHACENDRGIPGSGHIEWPLVMAALGELAYDGWLVIESFGFAIPEIVAAACIWRDLAPTPDAIAFDGARFLRRCIDRPLFAGRPK